MSSKMGRPTLHGIKIITPARIKKARLLLVTTGSRRQIAGQVFKCSPRTLRRITALDDPRAKALKHAIDEGERLKGEPLALLICMLIDKRNQIIMKLWEDDTYYAVGDLEQVQTELRKALQLNNELKNYINKDGREGAQAFSDYWLKHKYINLESMSRSLGLPPLQINTYLSHREGSK